MPFAWSTWVCITSRPGDNVTYTNNWPHDELVGNTPPSSFAYVVRIQHTYAISLSGDFSIVPCSGNKEEEIKEELPLEDPLRNMKPTPSMKATLKYIWVVTLILVQMLAGESNSTLWSRRKCILWYSTGSVFTAICIAKLACSAIIFWIAIPGWQQDYTYSGCFRI